MTVMIVLNYNDAETTLKYVKHIVSYDLLNKIIIVDNCSTDDSWCRLLQSFASNKIDIVRTDHNGGYGYGNNFGLKCAVSQYSPQ